MMGILFFVLDVYEIQHYTSTQYIDLRSTYTRKGAPRQNLHISQKKWILNITTTFTAFTKLISI